MIWLSLLLLCTTAVVVASSGCAWIALQRTASVQIEEATGVRRGSASAPGKAPTQRSSSPTERFLLNERRAAAGIARASSPSVRDRAVRIHRHAVLRELIDDGRPAADARSRADRSAERVRALAVALEAATGRRIAATIAPARANEAP